MVDRAFRCATGGDDPVHRDGPGTVIEHKIARYVQNLVDGMALGSRHVIIIDQIVYYDDW
jgi:hypothetical protein